MKRLTAAGFGAVFEAARDVIPAKVHDLIRPHYFCGADPVLAGLHAFESASYGRSYRDTAHVAYSFHQERLARSSRVTTVVLPRPPTLPVLIHELGHVLDEATGFTLRALPVTWYAETNRMEAFAEAFTAWLLPGYGQTRLDTRAESFFDSLS